MEVIAIVVLTIFYFILFEWAFNSNYKMYTFGGVEGRARAHLDNAMWFLIFAIGAAAFTAYVLRAIVTSEIFWFIVGGIVLLWLCGSSDKKASLLKELENDPVHWKKYTITFAPDKDGVVAADIFFFRRNSIWYNEETKECGADFIRFRKPNKDKDKIESALYRGFRSDIKSNEYYFVSSNDESKFKFYDHKLKDINNMNSVQKAIESWSTGENSIGGHKYDCGISGKLNPDGNGEWDLVYKRIKQWDTDGTSTRE